MKKLLAIITPLILGINIVAPTVNKIYEQPSNRTDFEFTSGKREFDLGTGIKLISFSSVVSLLNSIKAAMEIANISISKLVDWYDRDDGINKEGIWFYLLPDKLTELMKQDGFEALDFTLEYIPSETDDSLLIETLDYKTASEGSKSVVVSEWYDIINFFNRFYSYTEFIKVTVHVDN